MGRRPQPERRAALLEACADDLLAHGIAGATLARLARAAGTSPRMLVYHFSTRDGLVSQALRAARSRQRVMYERVLDPQPGTAYTVVLANAWATITAPPARPYLRLFGELHDLPADRAPWPGFREMSILDWLPTIEAGLTAEGRPNATAQATLLVATVRGLLSDLTTTNDLTRTTKAWHAMIDLLNQTGPA